MSDKKTFIKLIHKYVPFLYTVSVILATVYVTLRMRSWGNLVFPFDVGIFTLALAVFYLVITFRTDKTYMVGKNRTETYLSGFSTFVFMYLTLFTFLADMCLLGVHFLNAEKYNTFRYFLGFVVLAAAAAVTFYAYIHKEKINVVNYSIDEPSMDGQYRIVLLSDLHIGYYVREKQLSKIVEKVNSLDADMVVIAGDMINSGNTNECPDIDAAALALAKLKSREGTFACTGNHDPDLRDKDFRRFIKKADIRLLTDEVYNNGKFNLAGRNTCTKKRLSMEELRPEISIDMPLFIVDHDPMGMEEAQKAGCDLIMCGHTHKGQVFPLNLFVRMLYSKEQFYGFHKMGRMYTVVSSGAGYFSMPMRLGTNSEAVVIDINKK